MWGSMEIECESWENLETFPVRMVGGWVVMSVLQGCALSDSIKSE